MGKKDIHLVAGMGGADISWLSSPLSQEEKKKRGWYVDLTGDASPEDVDCILREMMERLYMTQWEQTGECSKEEFFREIIHRMRNRDLALSGGLRFVDGDVRINPGCCCGIEIWVGIAGSLLERYSPWMGHDPNVSFREEKGVCYISTVDLTQYFTSRKDKRGKVVRGRKGRRQRIPIPAPKIEDIIQDEKNQVIAYEPEEFDRLLAKLNMEFLAFVRGPLYRRIFELAPEYAEDFCSAFIRDIRRGDVYWFISEYGKEMKRMDKMEKVYEVLDGLGNIISREDFMSLAAVFLQNECGYFITGGMETGKPLEACYTGICYKYSNVDVILYITAGGEIPDADELKRRYPKPDIPHLLRNYVIISYENKTDDSMWNLRDMVSWLYREGGILPFMYGDIVEKIRQELKFMDEEPFTWWYRNGFRAD